MTNKEREHRALAQHSVNEALDFIMLFDAGVCSDSEVATGFQALIDSGLIWSLDSRYGAFATRLIECNVCRPARARLH